MTTPKGPPPSPDLRALPSVDRLLGHPRVTSLLESFPHDAVADLVRRQLDWARAAIRAGGDAPSSEDLAADVAERATELWRPHPRSVINATGVIIHTNLGRAPLSADALQAIRNVAEGYSDLEYDLAEGERGPRQEHIQDLLRQLTGAGAGLAVNNNAGALLLTLACLASDREVIVSRGEAVEIGGGFRIPDVLRQSGATLVEVGTTNRTYLRDYEDAVTPQTAAVLKVHAANFKVIGFTHAAETSELADLAHRHGLPLLHDLGSGCLLDTASYGLAHEPTPRESVEAGADLALFSGDKLLGGPQAGIAVGRGELVSRLARHPMARALRLDRLSMAGLSATLLHYVRGEATDKVPVWLMIASTEEDLGRRAESWRVAVGRGATTLPGRSTVGGGSLPGETLPTHLLSLDGAGAPGGAAGLARRLRLGDPPVVARVHEDRVLLDPRTVAPEEEQRLLDAVRAALGSAG